MGEVVLKANLEESTKRIQKVLADVACGPLRAAKDVLDIVERWPDFADQTQMTYGEWLATISHEGRHLKYWTDRKVACERIGTSATRRWNHHAAVWASNAYAKDAFALKRLVGKVLQELDAKGPGMPPFSENVVKRMARELFGSSARKPRPTCARCSKLEAILEKHGIAV